MEEGYPGLKDIYHRLKNHMAVINSLIRLKASSARSEPERKVLEETGGLVSAVTLVYQLLYREENPESISASLYLRELLQILELSADGNFPSVTLKLPPGDCMILPEKAVPLGIMTAELILNNTFRSSFMLGLSDRQGEWFFRLAWEGKSDNGPDLLLTESLVSQLDGTFSSDDNVVRIVFPGDLLISGQ